LGKVQGSLALANCWEADGSGEEKNSFGGKMQPFWQMVEFGNDNFPELGGNGGSFACHRRRAVNQILIKHVLPKACGM
jgi:hypothetical protein